MAAADAALPTRVFVGNLAWATNDETLFDHMAAVGTVTKASVLRYSDSGRSKGSGLVDFATPEDASRAIDELTDTSLDGRQIFVRADRGAAPPADRPPRRERAPRAERPAGGGGGAGGGGAGRPRSSFGPKGEPGTGAFVKNLSWDTTDEGLLHFFDEFRSVAAEINRRDGRSRGWGIVRFETADDCNAAIAALNNQDLDGRPVHVREYRED